MILTITHSEDYYTTDLVADYLKENEIDSIRINSDDFPQKYQISSSFPSNKSLILQNKDQVIDLKKVQAVWLRKFWKPKVDSTMDEKYKNYSLNESLETIKGLFYTLNDIFWIDRLNHIELSSNKMLQLKIAAQIGLKIPETLITNNQKQLKFFYLKNNRNIITKMQKALSCTMNSDGVFFYTQKLHDDDINNSGMLELCPMVFQEEIKKDYELRVIYVDGNYFTGKLSTKDKLTDTRVTNATNYKWETYELPKTLEIQLDILMHKLNLHFGAIDIIRSTNGNYYFLEVNPTGEWGMLQKELNLPIAQAIGKTLIKNI
ncbi:MAG: hypothetical protein MI739_09775 [Bacteroidales bacterium]|nr:hypothetical protein [Bacteroidales bacterium]